MSGNGESGQLRYYDLTEAEVSRRKVTEYLLNLLHPEGGSKAKFFWAKGFNSVSWELLADALRAHGIRNPVEDLIPTEWGIKVVIKCHIETPDGTNPCIVTVWMHTEGNNPKFVTAYPGQPTK